MIHILITIFILFALFVYFDMMHTPSTIKTMPVQLMENIKGKMANDLIIQAVKDDVIWASRGYTIYRSADKGNSFNRVFRIPVPLSSKYFLGNSRIITHILKKNALMEMYILNSHTIIVFCAKKIYRVNKKLTNISDVYGFKKDVSIHPQAITEDACGNVYYGEYMDNAEKRSVKIFRSCDDGITWDIFYSFSPGTVRHIHAVQYDKYTNTVWVATGDNRDECKIGFFKEGEKKLHIIGSGDQIWRTLSFLFTSNHVYWGTDSPSIQNKIFKYDRVSGREKPIADIDGPAYYSLVMKNGRLFVGTAVEGGVGEWDNKTSVWMSEIGEQWSRVIALEKDDQALEFAKVRFPKGDVSEYAVISFINTRCYNKSLLIIELDFQL